MRPKPADPAPTRAEEVATAKAPERVAPSSREPARAVAPDTYSRPATHDDSPPTTELSTESTDTSAKRRFASAPTTTTTTQQTAPTQAVDPQQLQVVVPTAIRTDADVAVTPPTVTTVDTLTQRDAEGPAPTVSTLTGLLSRKGGATARVDLPDLGRVAITATGHPGALNVTITPAKEAAVEALLPESAAITSDLRGSSVSLAHARVDISSGGSGGEKQGGRGEPQEAGDHLSADARTGNERGLPRRVRIVL